MLQSDIIHTRFDSYFKIILFFSAFRIPLTYFVLLKRHQEIISCPVAMKHEADMGNPKIEHLVFLIEAYKVCLDTFDTCALLFPLSKIFLLVFFSRAALMHTSLSIGGLKLWNVSAVCSWHLSLVLPREIRL